MFIARVHHQQPDNPAADSYHLVSTPSHTYVARQGIVFREIPMERSRWQDVVLRWVNQRLEVSIGGVLQAQMADQLLQSGYCSIAVSRGEARLRQLKVADLSIGFAAANGLAQRNGIAHSNGHGCSVENPRTGFTSTPRRNLIYHVWPVRGSMWRWNLEQLKSRIDLFNGRRLIGIVHDERAEDVGAVKAALEGHGCEFLVAPNSPAGEVVTFPAMLRQVASTHLNEVTFYAHAKGVRHEPNVPRTVHRWAEVNYRVTLDDWAGVREQLDHFALTGAFRMLGRFRAHQYAGDWHYSGTYFWLRHAHVFNRDCLEVPAFYGGVEAWPGIYFGRDETGCLLFDDLRQLAYHEQFWQSLGHEIGRWEAERVPMAPPPDLLKPLPFEHHQWPRLEQRPEEFAWYLDRLLKEGPRSLLTIGAMHGGVEWHVARRFRGLGKDIRITAVDIAPGPELLATLDDARHRFGQQIDLVEGDSTAASTRERLSPQYDAVFIDGDHSYRCSSSDASLALSLHPRIVGLHDVVDSDWHAQAHCCVSRLWSELRNRYVTEECASGDWGGIGVFYPNKPSK